MPSDERLQQLGLRALSRATHSFRAALGTTLDEVRHDAATHRAEGGQAARLGAELGPFGLERIDVNRFATLFGGRGPDATALEAITSAAETLAELVRSELDLFVVEVAPGGDLGRSVGSALERIGRAFAATRAVELSRNGRERHDPPVGCAPALPFRSWTRLQRLLAPPLIVHVDGADLHVGPLAEFMDGAQKLVLAVRGECPAAPLVRLITPRVFVTQTAEAATVERLASWGGPGVAAFVPETAAHFVHDPEAGAQLWERLKVIHLPEMRLKPVGGFSTAQQAEELEQLRALAARPAETPPVEPDAPAAASADVSDPVEELANWLIRQAGLEEPKP